MSNYDNDYTDDMYDRYMLTGEGAEYFEETPEEEYKEEIVTEEVVEYKDLNEMLDDTISYLKQQIKEKERIIKAQHKKTTQKKKSPKMKCPQKFRQKNVAEVLLLSLFISVGAF